MSSEDTSQTRPPTVGITAKIRTAWEVLVILLKPRQTRQLLVAFSILLLLFSYWLIFWRNSNEGLTFVNKLIIPPELRGELIEGRKRYRLVVAPGEREFHPGQIARTAGINGPYLGPTLRVRRGDQVDFTVVNQLDEMTTMHWHGMHVPARMDGTPHQQIKSGESWTASFEVDQEAGTMWYHPHPHGYTGAHAYMGIAGMLWIDDDNSEKLNLPKTYGVDDFPLVIQDREFDRDGQFRFRRGQGPAYGGHILVNGTLDPHLEVPRGLVRFRLLNGSNARTYHLGFSDNREFHQIATDGGFLESPVPIRRVELAPGERAEVVADFGNEETVLLKSFPEAGWLETAEAFFDGEGNGHFDLVQLRPKPITSTVSDIPAKLNTIVRLDEASAVKTRRMQLGGPRRDADGRPVPGGKGGPGRGIPINGKLMSMHRIDERVRLGDTEIWEIVNRTGQMHPFHVHLVQFQILDRDGRAATGTELGWKDTVRVHAGETVRIIARFDRHADPEVPYMYHCHIMEHEDLGMMGQFLVVEEPKDLARLQGRPNVLLFITGLFCSHCYEQVEKFDRALAAQDIDLLVISPQDESGSELKLNGTLISDTDRKWAGWFGMAHGDDSHGTLLLDANGREVWREAGHEPYMDADAIIRRAKGNVSFRSASGQRHGGESVPASPLQSPERATVMDTNYTKTAFVPSGL